MSEQVIAVINAICEKFGVAIDWTQDNVLPYLQELCQKYIRYEIATSICWCCIFIFLTVLSLLFAFKFHKKAMSLECKYDEYEPITWVALAFWACVIGFGITSIIVMAYQVFDIVTCYTFPEKMIIEFANSLVK